MTSNLDLLFQNVKTYRSTKFFKELLDVCKKFKNLAPYNAMLVHIQRPGAQYVLNERDWKKNFNRGIKLDARPIIILAAFGPVDYCFDISDTYPLSDDNLFENELLDELAKPFETVGTVSDKIADALFHNCALHGIALDFNFVAGSTYGGKLELLRDNRPVIYIPIGKENHIKWNASYMISVNKDARKNGECFATVLHELGHFFCGHLPAPIGWKPWEPRILEHNEEEFEAESVAWLICERLNIQKTSMRYLSGYLKEDGEIPKHVSIDRIFAAFNQIWDMINSGQTMSFKKGMLYKHNNDFAGLADKKRGRHLDSPIQRTLFS